MKDIILSISTFALSAFVYIYSATFANVEGGLAENPAYYPRILAIVLAVLSAVILVRTIIKKQTDDIKINKEIAINVSKTMAVLVIYAVGLNVLGFFMSTLIYTFAGIILFGGKLKTSLIYFVPITASIYLIFGVIFKMPLPTGIFLA